MLEHGAHHTLVHEQTQMRAKNPLNAGQRRVISNVFYARKNTSFQCPKRAYRVALAKKRQAAGKMEERKGRGGPSKGHGGPRPKQVAKVEKVVKAPVHDNQTDVNNMMKVNDGQDGEVGGDVDGPYWAVSDEASSLDIFI